MPSPKATAASLAPSAEEATDRQALLGVLTPIHEMPEFVEVNIENGSRDRVAATDRLPSAEDAIETQLKLGASLALHVAPESTEA